jgi:inorganic pyrophosphatase
MTEDIVDIIIEIPYNTNIKYEIDKKTNLLRVDRVLHTSMVYPGNYGYIPNTLADDKDPLDILMLLEKPLLPMTIVKSKIIGMLVLEDEAGLDDKIIAVPHSDVDKTYENINDIQDIPQNTLQKILHFFTHYKDLEPNKWVQVKQFKHKKEAIKTYKKSLII